MDAKLRATVMLAMLATLATLGLGAAPVVERSPDCMRVWPEARYVPYGYDQIVHLRNDCRTQAVCDVSTDVNPTPTEVAVRPGEQVEVLTMRASPSREFTPDVECRFVAAK